MNVSVCVLCPDGFSRLLVLITAMIASGNRATFVFDNTANVMQLHDICRKLLDPADEVLRTLVRGYNLVVLQIKSIVNNVQMPHVDRTSQLVKVVYARLLGLSADFGFKIPTNFMSKLDDACRVCPVSIPKNVLERLLVLVCAIVIIGLNGKYSSKTNFRKCVPHFDEMLKSCKLNDCYNSHKFHQTIRNLHKLLKLTAGFGSRSAKSAPFYTYRRDISNSDQATNTNS